MKRYLAFAVVALLVVALNGVVLAAEDSMKGMGTTMNDMSSMVKSMSDKMGDGMMKDEMKMKHMGAMMGDMSEMMKGMSDKMGSGTMTKDDMMMQQEQMKKMKDQMSGM